MKNIYVESLTLQELFEKRESLTIPEYQRPYVWSPKQIDKLLMQFQQHQERIDDKPMFYLGSIVLHKRNNSLEIIDGQQRITTLQTLAVVKNMDYNFDITYSHPISLKNIQSNYKYYSDNHFEIINFNKINITIVVVDDEDLAYNFFETLNTGGKRLSGTDILKAHHLRSITHANLRNNFALKWEAKQRNLESVNKILVQARRINDLNPKDILDKFASPDSWKAVLTEEFAENIGKNKADIGFSSIEIEDNTFRIISDKYAIRQPLNEGRNYINYLMSYSELYSTIFETKGKQDYYSNFNNEMIDKIDGTSDLRRYYQLCLFCFADKFGTNNILEFALWTFRHIYSLRLNEKSRIYEATVTNHLKDTKIIERIFTAYTYQEIISYLKNYKTATVQIKESKVKQRFFKKCVGFFELNIQDASDSNAESKNFDVQSLNFDKKLTDKIEQIVRKHYNAV